MESLPSAGAPLHSAKVAQIARPFPGSVGSLSDKSSHELEAQGLELASPGVTPRVVLLSLILAAFFGCAIPFVDYKFTNTFLGAAHLPAGAVAVLLALLLVVNPLLRLVSQRWAFSRNETLTIYMTCLFSVLVPGRGGENFFVPNIIASFYYATSENKWLKFLEPNLRPWFTPALTRDGHYNKAVVEGWYVGGHQPIPWSAWLVPLAAWSIVIIALYIMLGCLGVMLRAQWSEHEALAFPLLRLPLELTEDMDRPDKCGALSSFFCNPIMWLGFGLAVFIQLLNGLNVYYPDVPTVPLYIGMGPLLTEAPWNQIGSFDIRVWPMAVGISYLLTAEVSFSLWFFYLFTKFQLIAAYGLGYMPKALPDPIFTRGFAKSFVSYQQVGAYFAYVGFVLWIARHHFAHIVQRAFRRVPPNPIEKDEPLSYPAAFWGFVFSFSFIIGWTVCAGVRLDVALALWLTYLVVAIALTRVVVEGGLLLVHSGWGPLGPLSHLVRGWPAASSAVPGAFISGALMTELRGFLLPSFVQSFKLAHDRKIAMKPLLALIFAATLVSLAFALWTVLHLGYSVGGLQLQEWWARGNGAQAPAKNAKEIVSGVDDNFLLNWAFFAVGFLLTCGMMVARSRFLWFPFHPIGYIMCAPFALYTLWFSIFLGWFFKSLITRFGGTDSYRKAVPAFLGLALGDVSMMVMWVIIDAWQGRTGHILLPN